MNWKIPRIGTWGGISLLIAALGAMMAPSAQASAAPWQQLRPVGQGEMNWLWFKLYDATLYSQSGRYQPGHYPQALTLTYARDIERDDLLTATAEEWQRLGLGSETQRQQWLGQLAAFWPDVAAGDTLTFYVDEAGVGHFWWQDKPLGTLTDPQFAVAFLAIWLADNSRDPALTRRLRGQL
ncbi:chalcone isomerase family protein [Aeromonas salmonicida]|uniref:chalcone isomerase family protein n=1 Tax=Aeromonas salmonicida TaxID=645 RepID=UPI0024A839A4|nr:chalcone isomerase family protein [Aeromonas salmonicida]MDM5136196.1 chalcone isomerase family protein [Aeromonas salmonicida]WHF39370.1 chalcone isomerase family protein [Aeromonas salmonicida]